MKKDDKECALNPKQFRKIGSEIFIDISQLDETNDEVFNSIYYKEMPGATDDEIIIVTSKVSLDTSIPTLIIRHSFFLKLRCVMFPHKSLLRFILISDTNAVS